MTRKIQSKSVNAPFERLQNVRFFLLIQSIRWLPTHWRPSKQSHLNSPLRMLSQYMKKTMSGLSTVSCPIIFGQRETEAILYNCSWTFQRNENKKYLKWWTEMTRMTTSQYLRGYVGELHVPTSLSALSKKPSKWYKVKNHFETFAFVIFRVPFDVEWNETSCWSEYFDPISVKHFFAEIHLRKSAIEAFNTFSSHEKAKSKKRERQGRRSQKNNLLFLWMHDILLIHFVRQ